MARKVDQYGNTIYTNEDLGNNSGSVNNTLSTINLNRSSSDTPTGTVSVSQDAGVPATLSRYDMGYRESNPMLNQASAAQQTLMDAINSKTREYTPAALRAMHDSVSSATAIANAESASLAGSNRAAYEANTAAVGQGEYGLKLGESNRINKLRESIGAKLSDTDFSSMSNTDRIKSILETTGTTALKSGAVNEGLAAFKVLDDYEANTLKTTKDDNKLLSSFRSSLTTTENKAKERYLTAYQKMQSDLRKPKADKELITKEWNEGQQNYQDLLDSEQSAVLEQYSGHNAQLDAEIEQRRKSLIAAQRGRKKVPGEAIERKQKNRLTFNPATGKLE